MAFRDDRRAAAIQVGAVLLLGFLVIGLSLYQATVVPAQNKRVEFRHNQQVQNDLLDLRNALLRAGTTGSVQPVAIDMGTTYESRVLFVNPPPPGGLLRNGTGRNVTFSNARATNGETADFLNTSANGPYDLTTKTVSYRPGYNVYRSAPTTTYQSGVTVNEFENANDTAITGQTLVQGNRIYLVAVAGNVSRAQVRSLSVDPRSLSTSVRSTTVRNTSGGPLTITVPTTLHHDRWRGLLDPQYDDSPSPTDDDSRYVVGVDDGPRPNTVNVTLERGKTYRLRTALVAVGTGGSVPAPAYLTRIGPRNVTPLDGEELVVEVRDRYNNPVDPSTVATGLYVNVTSGTGLVTTDNVSVDDDGRARFTYNGTGQFEGRDLNVSVVGRSGEAWNVTFNVSDLGGGGGGNGGGNGGGGPTNLPSDVRNDDNPAQAFDDEDLDGVRDPNEKQYPASRIRNGNIPQDADLAIPSTVGTIRNQNNNLELQVNSINSEVNLESGTGNVQIQATNDVRLRGDVSANNGNVEISGDDIDTRNAAITSGTGNIEIDATGVYDASNGEIVADNGNVELTSNGDMFLDGTRVRSGTGSITADLGGPNTLHVDGTTVEEPNDDGILRYDPDTVTESPDNPDVAP